MAAQRDAHLSRLYWYTDLEEAKTEAKRTGRPILSLRLLGRLDEELSCANSRLFRMVLYSNESTAQFLRDTYVLHWSSERPAPQVTLDFGDGRVVKRTITGNSVHYVLDSQGRVIDALPGMYGPARFERTLRETIGLARDSGALDDEAASKVITKHHQHMVWALTAAWRKHLSDAYTNTYPDYVEKASLPTPAKMAWTDPLHDSLPASAVNELTYSKADMEAPTLSLLQPTVTVLADFGPWQKVMQGIPAEHLSSAGRELLREQHPRDWSTRETQPLDEAKLAKTVARFEQRVTDEGFRNEFMMHGSVHVVLARPGHLDFASTNDFVYSRLFMTPKDDGWLGLAPTDAVTGLSDDGIVSAP